MAAVAEVKTVSRPIPKKLRKQVIEKQNSTCANKPGANLKNLDHYLCPLWQIPGNNGKFDESGCHIDHIEPFALIGAHSEANLQALCPCCHAVKTKKDNPQTRIKKIELKEAERKAYPEREAVLELLRKQQVKLLSQLVMIFDAGPAKFKPEMIRKIAAKSDATWTLADLRKVIADAKTHAFFAECRSADRVEHYSYTNTDGSVAACARTPPCGAGRFTVAIAPSGGFKKKK